MDKELSQDFWGKARKFWSEGYGREISLEETREIHRNLEGFFRLLAQWKAEDDAKKRLEEGVNKKSEVENGP